MYNQYADEKASNPFDDSKRMNPQPVIPLAAPQPGYAAPVAALNLARPSPAATPEGRTPEMSQYSGGMASSMPNTPHPLLPPMTPIAPAFARPSTATSRDVKFEAPAAPIMRGESEDTVLPRRGQRGDDFWRRFSMVVKEDLATPAGQKQSIWLKKTQNGTTRMSRWVWIIGMGLLLIIAGAIGLGWYVSHNSTNTTHSAPTAIGGSANEKASGTSDAATASSAGVVGGAAESSSSVFHVTPTNTVARRAAEPIPTPLALYPVSARGDGPHHLHVMQTRHRHRRGSPVNRTSH